MRGRKWESSVDDILIARYANESNQSLAKELGYGVRTIERHARYLGLSKSNEYMQMTQYRAAMEGVRWFEYMRITGQKIRKGNCNGKRFEKGRIPDPEMEKKRIDAIRARAWEDRKRIIHGLLPKSKWKWKLDTYKPK